MVEQHVDQAGNITDAHLAITIHVGAGRLQAFLIAIQNRIYQVGNITDSYHAITVQIAGDTIRRFTEQGDILHIAPFTGRAIDIICHHAKHI